MSRYRGPRVKKMRALGLDLPGLSRKSIERRPQPPGQHIVIGSAVKPTLRLVAGFSRVPLMYRFSQVSPPSRDSDMRMAVSPGPAGSSEPPNSQ